MKVIQRIGFLLFFLLSTVTHAEKIWIDTDLAIGSFLRDPDDGLALALALVSPELEVVGVSLSFGNIKNLKAMRRKARRIFRRTNHHPPLYFGAGSTSDLFKKTPAIMALAEALEKEPLIIVNMGRLSTLAAFGLHYPDLLPRIKKVILNAGNRKGIAPPLIGKRALALPDTNIDGDVLASSLVVSFGLPLVMMPVEAMANQFVDSGWISELKKNSNLGRWLSRRLFWWKKAWRIYPGSKGFIPFDIFLVGYLLGPQDYQCYEQIQVGLVYRPNNHSSILRKRYAVDYKFYLEADEKKNGVATYCYSISDGHLEYLLKYY